MNRLLLVASVLGLSICCGSDHPTTPVSPTAPTPSVQSIEITGTTQLTAIGQVSQLGLTATFFNASPRDVARESNWRSNDSAVATVTVGGVLTAVAPGRTGVVAEYQGRFVAREVTVLPSGTFLVKGRVSEPGNLPLFAARVEIVEGQQTGRAVITNNVGAYEIYGVAGQVSLRATKSDYMPVTQAATVLGDSTVNFELPPNTAPLMVGGTYRVTFNASNGCAANLPESARTRTYRAVLQQTSARIDIQLFDANFAINPQDRRGSGFSATLHGSTLQFSIGDTYYRYFEDLVEQLDATTFLTINGFTTATATPSETSGVLRGTFTVWDAPNGLYAPGPRQTVRCSGDHPFVFTRQ